MDSPSMTTNRRLGLCHDRKPDAICQGKARRLNAVPRIRSRLSFFPATNIPSSACCSVRRRERRARAL